MSKVVLYVKRGRNKLDKKKNFTLCLWNIYKKESINSRISQTRRLSSYLESFGVNVTPAFKVTFSAMNCCRASSYHPCLRSCPLFVQAEAGKFLQTVWLWDAAHYREKFLCFFFMDRLFSRFNNKIHSVDMNKLIIKLWICFPLPEAKPQTS